MILLSPRPVAMDALAVGASRIGGDPDLPRGAAWPHHAFWAEDVAKWPDYAQAEVERAKAEGWLYPRGTDHLVTPLPFLAQLDLAELSDARLPLTGTLLFFAQVSTDVAQPLASQKPVASAVLFSDGPLVRTAVPDSVRAQKLEMNAPAHALSMQSFAGDDPPRPAHIALPPPISDGCVALLQIDSDFGAHFGDDAWITFSIPENALAERRFDLAFAEIWLG